MDLRKKPSLWVATTYFAEGLPFMMTRVISSIYFTDMGVREAWLGFLNFLGIPWNLKFLWAPFVDLFSTKRNWMLKAQLGISLLLFVVTLIVGLDGILLETNTVLSLVAFVFLAMAFISATHDIAIDAYYLEGITDKAEQAGYSGFRIMAYRIAIVYSRTLLVALAGLTTWTYGFGVGATTMLALYIFHRIWAPHFEKTSITRPPFQWSEIFRAFRTYLQQDKMWIVIPFIIGYKLGDEILFSMNTPFLMRELLVTKTQLAWLGGIVGAASVVAGALFGAWWIKKSGLKKAIWPLTLLMNINIWAYVGLAYWKPLATDPMGLTLIAIVHGYEQWANGLGNAVLMIYLMRLCKLDFKAAHYAIGSAIMSLGSTFFGGFGGVIVEAVGYTSLFMIGFFSSIPSMILLFFVPLHEEG